MSATHEVELQVRTFTGTCPGVVGYSVVDHPETEESLIEIHSIQSVATRWDMMPAVDGKALFVLKMLISQIEAEKAVAA